MKPAAALDAAIGLGVVETTEHGSLLRLEPTEAAIVEGDPPFLHGGALATCVDSAAWAAVDAAKPGGNWVVTDLRLDCLRLARAEPHVVRGVVRRAGRRLAVVDVEIAPAGEPERPVALGRVSLLLA
ncbi:MAG: hotdog domain-containing protein [Gaiella sp.]